MLTERQHQILNIIVDDYIHTATPIASETIAQHHDLGVSPATIRSDVAQLQEDGYIFRPHSSSGSVPLDSGYRIYVESIDDSGFYATGSEGSVLARNRLTEVEQDFDEWANVAVKTLSHMVGNLALATFPKPSESKVKYIELVYLHEFTTMLILVMEQAHLKKHVIRLSSPISQMEVEVAGNKVRSELVGLTSRDVIELDTRGYSPIEVAMLDTTIEMLEQEDGQGYSNHYLDGLRNLLAQPEFEASDSIRSVVNGIEDGSLIDAILGEQPVGDTVRVVIGQEHDGSFLWPLSVVLSLYGIPGKAQGVLGAIGPTRMEYLSTIASVKLLSSIMSEQIETAQGIW